MEREEEQGTAADWEDRLMRLIQKFEEHLGAANYSRKTIISYVYDLRCFVEYLKTTEITNIGQINKDTMCRYQLYLYNYINGQGKKLCLAMQLGRLVAVRSFFRYMVKRGYFLYDPAGDLDLPRVKRKLPGGIMS